MTRLEIIPDDMLVRKALAELVVLITIKGVDISEKENRTEYEQGYLKGINDAIGIVLQKMRLMQEEKK